MKQILKPLPIFEKICGEQNIPDKNANLSMFVLQIPCDDGILLYHTLSGELILLSEEEFAQARNLADLSAHWFFVAQTLDEYQMAVSFRKVAAMFQKQKEGITSFTIFPTTDCNARCFYCYELGRPRVHMSDSVAEDAAAYIDKVRKGQDVSITWFGGEPLYNEKAIDVLCAKLRSLQVPFSSKMVSNGFLFDAAKVKKAKELWNLTAAQITLDGTEQIYNQTKAYISHEGSAFLRVLQNIDLLLNVGIKVVIRLNLNRENEKDLYVLTTQLFNRFSGQKKPEIYAVLLKNFGRDVKAYQEARQAIAVCDKLNAHIQAHGFGHISRYSREPLMNRCMADNDHSLTILPDGRLGKCEHESEQLLVGSIYEERLDEQAIQSWKQRVFVPACKTCPLASRCITLRNCAWDADDCTQIDRDLKISNLRKIMLREYYQWKEQQS